MIRLTRWFRRSRPPVGGPAAPAPVLRPRPYSSAWHQVRAHKTGVAVHMAYGRFLVGHGCASPDYIADVAERAAEEWLRFAIALRAETAALPPIPDDLSDLEGA